MQKQTRTQTRPERKRVAQQVDRTHFGEMQIVSTYVVESQIRMVALDAVVQDGHDDALARVTLLPGRSNVHVRSILGATVLQKKKSEKTL